MKENLQLRVVLEMRGIDERKAPHGLANSRCPQCTFLSPSPPTSWAAAFVCWYKAALLSSPPSVMEVPEAGRAARWKRSGALSPRTPTWGNAAVESPPGLSQNSGAEN